MSSLSTPTCLAPSVGSEAQDPQERLRSAIRRPGISLAVLFGSRAEGRARADSDHDIGVIADHGIDLDVLCATLERVAGGRVDVVDLRHANPVLCMEVARHGTVLVDVDDNRWPAFVSLSLRRFEDTRKLRALQTRALDEFLAQRGYAPDAIATGPR